jgi:hypothetical protein
VPPVDAVASEDAVASLAAGLVLPARLLLVAVALALAPLDTSSPPTAFSSTGLTSEYMFAMVLIPWQNFAPCSFARSATDFSAGRALSDACGGVGGGGGGGGGRVATSAGGAASWPRLQKDVAPSIIAAPKDAAPNPKVR